GKTVVLISYSAAWIVHIIVQISELEPKIRTSRVVALAPFDAGRDDVDALVASVRIKVGSKDPRFLSVAAANFENALVGLEAYALDEIRAHESFPVLLVLFTGCPVKSRPQYFNRRNEIIEHGYSFC